MVGQKELVLAKACGHIFPATTLQIPELADERTEWLRSTSRAILARISPENSCISFKNWLVGPDNWKPANISQNSALYLRFGLSMIVSYCNFMTVYKLSSGYFPFPRLLITFVSYNYDFFCLLYTVYAMWWNKRLIDKNDWFTNSFCSTYKQGLPLKQCNGL